MMLSMAALMIATVAFACTAMGAFLGAMSSQATSRWGWAATVATYAATSGTFGGLLAYTATALFPVLRHTRVSAAELAAPISILGLVTLTGWGRARRRQRRLCTIARRLDSTARAIWTPIANDVARWHSEQGTEDWVLRHFDATEDALARHQGDVALANLRHATVRLAIALRPLIRANPSASERVSALARTLAIRDEAIRQVHTHKIGIARL